MNKLSKFSFSITLCALASTGLSCVAAPTENAPSLQSSKANIAVGSLAAGVKCFEQMGVPAARSKYDGILSWGKGQTLAILDDGCKTSAPQWQAPLPWGPKVIATHNVVEGGDDTSMGGTHGTLVGIPSSINYNGMLGVAYNDQIAPVRVVRAVHLKGDEAESIAKGLQWVIDNHEKYHITTVNLSPGDSKAHQTPLASVIDEKLKKLRELNIWVSAPTGNGNLTTGISWPACAQDSFAIGATLPGKHAIHLDRWSNVDLLVAGPYTSFSNAGAAGCSMILREAIEKSNYDWKRDGKTLPDAMMKIFQETGVKIHDDATNLDFRELNLVAALDHVYGK